MKVLKTYLKNQKKAFLKELEMPIKKYGSETFHKLRVEIKKLNSLFDLIDYSSKQFKRTKRIAPFKLIYHQAGKVRDLQIEKDIYKTYLNDDLFNEYSTKLNKKLKNEKKQLFMLIDKKNNNTI